MKMNDIINYLNELYPNPSCELNYNKDYELLIAVMLSAQSTDKRVNQVTSILFNKYKTIDELYNADIEDIRNIIKPVGNQNKKAIYIKDIANFVKNNKITNDRTKLESINGIGRKTTNLVLGLLFNEQCLPVDTHVKRVSTRLNLVNEKDNVDIIEKKLTKKFKNYDLVRLHLQLVLFGRYKCKAIKPLCNDCKFKNICKRTVTDK